MALLALWRRSCLVHRFLVDRLSNCACSNADLAILRPSMKAEIQMCLGGFELEIAQEMEWEKGNTLRSFCVAGLMFVFKAKNHI